MPTGTTKIILTGENARAIKAINEVGTASEKAAAKSSSAFDKSTSKVGGLFSKLDKTLGGFGIPLVGALGAMGGKLESSGSKAETFGKKLVHVGDVAAITAAVGIAAVGTAAIHAALEGEAAHARLTTAVANTGHSYDDYAGKVDNLNSHMEKLGFENDDVESSLATLTGATKDTGKAIELMGLASDIARGRHISLEEATSILVKVETGRVGALGRLGIATKDATGQTISQQEALKRLTDLYGGQASAFTDTYAGKVAAMQATVKNLEEELGQKLIPVVEGVVDSFLSGIQTFDKINDATGGVAGKMALLSGGALAAAYAGAKLVQAYSATVTLFSTVAAKIGLKTAAEVADATATSAAATANAANATAIEAEGVAAATTAGEMSTLGASAGAGGAGLGIIGAAGTTAAVGVAALGEAYGQAKLKENTQDSGLLAKGMAILGSSISSVVPGAGVVTSALGFMGVGQDKAKKSSDDLTASTDKLKAAQDDYSKLLASGTASESDLAAARDKVAAASGQATEAQRKQKVIQDSVNAATEAGTGASQDNADASKEQADAAKALTDELNSLYDTENSLLGSQLSLKESTNAVSKAVQDHTEKTLIAIKAKGKDQKANEDVTDSGFALSRSILQVGQNASKAAIDAETLRQKNLGLNDAALIAKAGHDAEIASLRALEVKFPQLKPEIEGYIRTLNTIPASKQTTLQVNGYEDAVTKLRTVANLIGSGTQTSVITFSGGGGGQYRARQHGGPVSAGSPYVVGEKGPELFIPKVSGTVVPNGAAPKKYGTSGGDTYLTIYAQGIGDRELGRQVVQALREYQRTRGPLNLKIAG